MNLLMHDPNPLNVLDIRELNFCPKHFETITLHQPGWRIDHVIGECRRWIYNNLNGRFCVVSDLGIVDNRMEIVYKIGFEEPGESTIFSLGCSVLHDQGLVVL